jgi:hypothetical protein
MVRLARGHCVVDPKRVRQATAQKAGGKQHSSWRGSQNLHAHSTVKRCIELGCCLQLEHISVVSQADPTHHIDGDVQWVHSAVKLHWIGYQPPHVLSLLLHCQGHFKGPVQPSCYPLRTRSQEYHTDSFNHLLLCAACHRVTSRRCTIMCGMRRARQEQQGCGSTQMQQTRAHMQR